MHSSSSMVRRWICGHEWGRSRKQSTEVQQLDGVVWCAGNAPLLLMTEGYHYTDVFLANYGGSGG